MGRKQTIDLSKQRKGPVQPLAQRFWLRSLFLVAAVFLAYLPALRGGFVWDDDAWTTGISGLLHDFTGLAAMWRRPAALQQYYPLTGTSFWLDYQFWKFWTTPYHVENVLLHALAALLFWRLLRRLQIPGAGLAAALFALHPVMAESVAWITERKNVLSLVLYLAALLAYLRFAPGSGERRVTSDEPNTSRSPVPSSLNSQPSTLNYVLSLLLFLGALLAKTTAFSLPAVILLIAWWRRGSIRWRADVLPTLPFFALSISLCLATAWLEKHHVGARGSDFELTLPQRCLIAGRVPWFYLGQLLWPAQLCFVYPRWQPDPDVWWQWLYPAAAAGALFALWRARQRIGRGPLTAALYFGGTLLPVLGFMNAYFMRFSFVCDHWVYVSSLGVFALMAALVTRTATQLRTPALAYGFAVIVLPVLAVLTGRQAGNYRDMETLWQTTLAGNPNAFLADNNLGSRLAATGRLPEAIDYFQRAIALHPDYIEARYNLGQALAVQGRWDEAVAQLQRVVQLKPDDAEAHYNLGVVFGLRNQPDKAIEEYRTAIAIKPEYAEAHNNLGNLLAGQGRSNEAIEHYQKAVQIKPDHANAHHNLANALAAQDRLDEAVREYQRTLELAPNFAQAHFGLGLALKRQGKSAEARAQFQQTLQWEPAHAAAAQQLRALTAPAP
jgi:protein O-mannosyl-transferase